MPHAVTRVPGDREGRGSPDGEPVPRLPRGRGLRLSRPELMRILGLLGVLVVLLVTQRHCSKSVATFVTSFGSGSADAALPRPGTVDVPSSAPGRAAAGSAGAPEQAGHELDGYERLRPGMTDAEIKAAIERARARAAGSAQGEAPAGAPPVR